MGQRQISNASSNANELYVDRDITVLANPEIAGLPNWIIALVAAGGLAAALSTAAGLLLVISTSVSHDLIKKQFAKNISDRKELMIARFSAVFSGNRCRLFWHQSARFCCLSGCFGLWSGRFFIFSAIVMVFFSKRMNREGAIAGMIAGLVITTYYIARFKLGWLGTLEESTPDDWWFGISPEGFGTVGMLVNFIVAIVVSQCTAAPPKEVQEIVENIRIPSGAGEATIH